MPNNESIRKTREEFLQEIDTLLEQAENEYILKIVGGVAE